MVAVVIAVADAKPLRFLPAALNAAGDFSTWATAQGYETTLVTDEDDVQPVTTQRLSTTLQPILDTAAARPIERLVLYFAGHGLIQGAEEALWLTTDWNKSRRCVRVSLLKRLLFTYEIDQVSIFSDACRLLPATEETANLTQDGLICAGTRLRAEDDPAPPVDTFVAAQDFAKTFSVPGPTPEEDRCIFTGVLMPGLWGAKREAFSTIQTDRVVSRSLGKYLTDEVRRVARMYKSKLVPAIYPMFPEGADTYYMEGAGHAVAPHFPDWPSVGTVLPEAPAKGPAAVSAGEQRVLEIDAANTVVGPLDVASGDERRAGREIEEVHVSRPRKRSESLSERLRGSLVADFSPISGVIVVGADVKRFWAPSSVSVAADTVSGRWTIRETDQSELRHSAPVLVEIVDGQFAALVALPNFVAGLVCDARGVSALVYRARNESPASVTAAVKALARMQRGALRSTDVVTLAVNLRKYKHVDPVLGVVSAYLYDSLGDTQSIRRMAYFYTSHGQPIPYDVALLAQLRGRLSGGVYHVDVPAVRERAPRTKDEERHSWTFSATPRADGEVGGMWPWLRQGWPLLNDPTDIGSMLIHHELRGLVDHLRPGRFATLDHEGGLRLAEVFDLVECTPLIGPGVPTAPPSAPMLPPSMSAG